MNKQEAKEYKVEVGESLTVYCEGCSTEYKVIHEPAYTTEALKKGFGGGPKNATICPFCGSDDAAELEPRG